MGHAAGQVRDVYHKRGVFAAPEDDELVLVRHVSEPIQGFQSFGWSTAFADAVFELGERMTEMPMSPTA